MKNLFIIQEIKLFNLKLNTVYFLGEPFRVFYHCFVGRFHFFMFSFLHVFISLWFHFFRCFLGVFIVDCICSLHRFLSVCSLFVHWCIVTASATDLREKFLLWGVLYLTISSCFYQDFSGSGSSALKVGGFPTQVQNTDPAHPFVWIT